MATADEIRVIVRSETERAVRGLRNFDQQARRTNQGTQQLLRTWALKAAAAAGVTVSLTTLVRTLQRARDAYFDAERSVAAFENALRLTGTAGQISSRGIQQLASELQSVTMFSSEATLEAAAMAQQFASFSDQELRRAIPLIQDFAQATGTSLETAARQIGQAVEGSSTALSRYGIDIDTAADRSERAGSVLDQLSNRFGGTAEAIGGTAEAAGVQLKNALDDLLAVGGQMSARFFEPLQRGLTEFIENATDAVNAVVNLQDAFGLASENIRVTRAELIANASTFEDVSSIIRGLTREMFDAAHETGNFRAAVDQAGELDRLNRQIDRMTDTMSSSGEAVSSVRSEIDELFDRDFTQADDWWESWMPEDLEQNVARLLNTIRQEVLGEGLAESAGIALARQGRDAVDQWIEGLTDGFIDSNDELRSLIERRNNVAAGLLINPLADDTLSDIELWRQTFFDAYNSIDSESKRFRENRIRLAEVEEEILWFQRQSQYAIGETAEIAPIIIDALERERDLLQVQLGLVEDQTEEIEEQDVARTGIAALLDRHTALQQQINDLLEEDERKLKLISDTWGRVNKALSEGGGSYAEIREIAASILEISVQQLDMEVARKLVAEEFAGTMMRAAETMGTSMLRGLEQIGEAMVTGESAAGALGDAVRRGAAEIARQVSTMALGAGLRLIAEMGAAGIPLAIPLLAIAGVSAVASGIFGGGAGGAFSPDQGPQQQIVSAEEQLARERIEIIRQQLREERDMRRDNIRRMEREYQREFDVLKDMLDRNLISHDEFRQQAAALQDRSLGGIEGEEASIRDAEEQAAREEQEQQVEIARAAKVKAIQDSIRTNEDMLDGMNWWQKNVSQRSRAQDLEDTISRLRGRLNTAQNATTMEEVQAAKFGGSFETRGSALLRVGDNPGGRERIDVTPIGTPNRHGPSAGGIHIHVHGPVYGIEDLHRQLQQAGRRLSDRGVA